MSTEELMHRLTETTLYLEMKISAGELTVKEIENIRDGLKSTYRFILEQSYHFADLYLNRSEAMMH